ncbi:uncharacterized protein (TIGR02001 family) [Sphingomonas naasensis]|uniref:Porin n=1 Tax=Sphingomonas naasensis TaxID=1344951 RepID=A0A4S1WQV8_9SPHN|nr:TorF family putative porin [Sphingomonas naasensis]NIJ20318.1 uncharacterized protein (TIGR02001 family) [Sphingomonas naasensis]TGX44440.1 hypothetical protein E5A74_06530 [Sphingomonas naasensis]
MLRPALPAALALLFSAPALAQERSPALAVSGEAALVSDYRFRGLSVTDLHPALQAGVTVTHKSGAYANVWASNLADTPLYGEVELDFSAGWSGGLLPGGTLDVGASYYSYPAGSAAAGKANYAELTARYAQGLGPVTATLELGYSPAQRALGDRDSVYVSGDVEVDVPHTPLTLTAHLGRTSGAQAPDAAYADWSLGARVALGAAEFGLAYVDTDLADYRPGRAGLVGSASIGF